LLDPDFGPARAGKRRISALVARQSRPHTRRVLLTVALAVIAAGGVGAVGVLSTRPPSPDPSLLATLNDLRNGEHQIQNSQQSQAQRLGTIDGQLNQAAPLRAQQTVDNLTSSLAGDPALTAQVNGGAVTIVFREGVFGAGAQLSDAGSSSLADLMRRLGPFVTGVSVTVVGHTDDSAQPHDSGYTSNNALGLARAMAAAAELSKAGGLPLSNFALSSSGAADPPYANATAAQRARNRTVTVVVHPN
jgi:flagellar motor protein MotB